MFKSGFISIVGRSNVGKSTFLNKIIGSKVSITSSKVQTTRNNIRGIINGDDHQLVFVDTPGIHKPKEQFGEMMNSSAMESIKDCELILFMVEANSKFGAGDQRILEIVKNKKTPVFLVVNKIDLLKTEVLLEKLTEFNSIQGVDQVIPISAETGKNIDVLIEQVLKMIPEGPQYFDNDTIVDQETEFLLAEFIREQVLHKTEQEVPHGVATMIETMKFDRKKDLWIISGIIFVERNSHKKIIVGRAGKMISAISKNSRYKIKFHLKKDVYLKLFVKVKKKWKSGKDIIKIYGYE